MQSYESFRIWHGEAMLIRTQHRLDSRHPPAALGATGLLSPSHAILDHCMTPSFPRRARIHCQWCQYDQQARPPVARRGASLGLRRPGASARIHAQTTDRSNERSTGQTTGQTVYNPQMTGRMTGQTAVWGLCWVFTLSPGLPDLPRSGNRRPGIADARSRFTNAALREAEGAHDILGSRTRIACRIAGQTIGQKTIGPMNRLIARRY